FGVGVRNTCCSDPPCASGRGRSPGTPRRCVPYGPSTGPPDARPHPLSRQSRGLSAIDRFSASAMPFLLPPFVQTRGRPRSPQEGTSGWAGLLQPGVSLLCRPMTKHRNASAMHRRSARRVFLRRVPRLLPASLLVADGEFESRRLRPGDEEESLLHLETVTTCDRKERKGDGSGC